MKVKTRSGRDLCTLNLPSSATTDDLRQAFHESQPRYYPERQRFTLSAERGAKALVNGKTPLTKQSLSASGTNTIYFKDLGAQVTYRSLFIIEYLGPLVLYLLFLLPQTASFIYGVPASKLGWESRHFIQQWAAILWVIHYVKRELETMFVHRFGNATAPISSIFKNSIYYWGFGAYVGYYVNHPLYTAPENVMLSQACAVLFLLCEVANGYCHIILRNLRTPGTRDKKIPYGFLFEFVSCPNYFFEISAWLFFTIMTSCLPALLFTIVGGGQMWIWAVGKHKKYHKDFAGKYPRNRKILIPFIA